MKTFFAWLLIIVGGLWLLLAGGCTASFLFMSLSSILKGGGYVGEGLSILPMVLIAGLIGIAPAALILWGGLALRRAARPVARPDQDHGPDGAPEA